MRIEQLEYLLAISETTSISLASQKLHISQQNISKAIQKLEEELSVTLLNRSNHGVTLTENGKLVLEHAKNIFAEIECMHKELNSQEYPNLSQGNLRVAYNNSFNYSLLMQSINNFHKDYPLIRFSFQQNTFANILNMLCNQQIDIGLFSIDSNFHLNEIISPQELQSLQSLFLYSDMFMVAVSKSNKLSTQHSITPASLLKYPLIFYIGETAGSRENLDNNWYYKKLCTYGTPNITMMFDSMMPYLYAIEKDVGIGTLTKSSLNILPESISENITLIPFSPNISVDVLCFTHVQSTSKNLIDTYLPYLTSYI